MNREWFAITCCSNEVRAKFSANQKQELSLSKLRVFQHLTSAASIFLALCLAQFTVSLIGQTYFLTLSGFPATPHLRLKNYSVKHFHTYPFHPRCYDLHTDQIWTWDPCEIKRKKKEIDLESSLPRSQLPVKLQLFCFAAFSYRFRPSERISQIHLIGDITIHGRPAKRNFSSRFEKIFHEWVQLTSQLFFNTNHKCLTAHENTARWLLKNDITHVWIKMISSWAGLVFYRLTTTRYTIKFYTIEQFSNDCRK